MCGCSFEQIAIGIPIPFAQRLQEIVHVSYIRTIPFLFPFPFATPSAAAHAAGNAPIAHTIAAGSGSGLLLAQPVNLICQIYFSRCSGLSSAQLLLLLHLLMLLMMVLLLLLLLLVVGQILPGYMNLRGTDQLQTRSSKLLGKLMQFEGIAGIHGLTGLTGIHVAVAQEHLAGGIDPVVDLVQATRTGAFAAPNNAISHVGRRAIANQRIVNIRFGGFRLETATSSAGLHIYIFFCRSFVFPLCLLYILLYFINATYIMHPVDTIIYKDTQGCARASYQMFSSLSAHQTSDRVA